MADLRNYFMKPQVMKSGLEIYPVKIMEYEEFRNLANKYIVMNISQLNNKRKQVGIPKLTQKKLYAYLIDMLRSDEATLEINEKINQMENIDEDMREALMEADESIKLLWEGRDNFRTIEYQNIKGELCRLFEIVLKQPVTYNKKLKCFNVCDDHFISNINFEEFREIVMKQNLLFEPLVAPSIKAQKYIDASLKNPSSAEVDMEAVVAFVCTNSSAGDISNYTYYRLMADFHSLMKQMNRGDIVLFSASGATKKNGGQLDIPNVLEKLGIDKNPYDNVFKEKSND